jgi:hypothetical protein
MTNFITITDHFGNVHHISVDKITDVCETKNGAAITAIHTPSHIIYTKVEHNTVIKEIEKSK